MKDEQDMKELRKYWMTEDRKLMRYDEEAVGEPDNAHHNLWAQVELLQDQSTAQAAEIERLKADCAAYHQHIKDHAILPDDECQSGYVECQFCGGIIETQYGKRMPKHHGHDDDCPVIVPNPGRHLLQLAAAVEDDGVMESLGYTEQERWARWMRYMNWTDEKVARWKQQKEVRKTLDAVRAARDKEPTI